MKICNKNKDWCRMLAGLVLDLVYNGFIYLVDLTRNIRNHPVRTPSSGDIPSVNSYYMAYTQTLAMHQQYRDAHTTAIPMQRRQANSKQRFVTDLSQCLFDFVIQLLPTQEEMAVKEDVRKLLERLIRTIEPDSRLLSFGSTANGFSLRNSGKLPIQPRHTRSLSCCRYGPLLPH